MQHTAGCMAGAGPTEKMDQTTGPVTAPVGGDGFEFVRRADGWKRVTGSDAIKRKANYPNESQVSAEWSEVIAAAMRPA
jgi:hypothetical protein